MPNSSSNQPIDWRKFADQMIKQFTTMSNNWQGTGPAFNIKKMMEQVLSQTMDHHQFPFGSFHSAAPSALNYEVFETHRNVFVKIRPADSEKDMALSVNKRKLNVEVDGRTHTISLPHEVDSDRATAQYKDGILEVRLPKLDSIDQMKPISYRKT